MNEYEKSGTPASAKTCKQRVSSAASSPVLDQDALHSRTDPRNGVSQRRKLHQGEAEMRARLVCAKQELADAKAIVADAKAIVKARNLEIRALRQELTERDERGRKGRLLEDATRQIVQFMMELTTFFPVDRSPTKKELHDYVYEQLQANKIGGMYTKGRALNQRIGRILQSSVEDPFNGVWLNGSLDGNTRVINVSFWVGGRNTLISWDREHVVLQWCASRTPPLLPDPDGGSRITCLRALRIIQNGASSLVTAS